MSIPMPKTGHWQKLKFGKKVKRVPLPDNYKGEQKVSFSLRDEKTPFPVKGESPLSVLKHQIENDSSLKLTVPDKLANPDKPIIAARESLNRKDSYAHHGLISCQRGELDIRATKENISRALRFMGAFIKAMRARGHEIIVENDSTYAVVKTQKLAISLREKTKRIPGTDRWQTSILSHINEFSIFQKTPEKVSISQEQMIEENLLPKPNTIMSLALPVSFLLTTPGLERHCTLMIHMYGYSTENMASAKNY